MSYQFASKVKRAVADQIEEELYKNKLTKTILANRMGTSRTAINRLLDPENTSVTLNTLEKVALALSKRLKIEFS
jgi:DNA-binding Xre family transcriptional regulator